MRQFFYKSGLLCLVISMMSFLTLFSLTSYSNSGSIKKIAPFLSEDYAVMSNDGLTVEQFYEKTKDLTDDYVAGVCLPDGYSRAVFLGDKAKESINIKEGRFFTDEEIADGSNVALISEKNRNFCRKDGEDYYFSFRGHRFKVVGFFEAADAGTGSVLRIFNMSAEAFKDYSDWQYGFFDCGEVSAETLKKALNIEVYKFGTKEADIFNEVFSNIEFMLLLFFVVIFLVTINIFSALNTWIEGKRKELAIRKLSGATARDISKKMWADYFSVSCIAFLIGLCVFYIFMAALKVFDFSESLSEMLGNAVMFKDVVIAFACVSLIGCLILPGYVKREKKIDILPAIKGRFYLND